MLGDDTDREWEKFGKNDPYFGVLSDEKFRESNLTEDIKAEFFRSGFAYIDDVLAKIKQHVDADFTPNKALDFGCGVGRLVIPLANVAREVTGVDVSDSMLQEARKNCEVRSISNATFIQSDDELSGLRGHYDFIHSFIVFQHIPVSRGEKIFKSLILHLESEGVCVLHFTYAQPNASRGLIPLVKKYVPFVRVGANFFRRRKLFGPEMQMHAYDLNHLFFEIQKANVVNCYAEFTNHGGWLGVIVYFQKPKLA